MRGTLKAHQDRFLNPPPPPRPSAFIGDAVPISLCNLSVSKGMMALWRTDAKARVGFQAVSGGMSWGALERIHPQRHWPTAQLEI